MKGRRDASKPRHSISSSRVIDGGLLRNHSVHTIDCFQSPSPKIHCYTPRCDDDCCYASLVPTQSHEPRHWRRRHRCRLRCWPVCPGQDLRSAAAHERGQDRQREVSSLRGDNMSCCTSANRVPVCDVASSRIRRTAHTPFWPYSRPYETRLSKPCPSSRLQNNYNKRGKNGLRDWNNPRRLHQNTHPDRPV